MRSLPRIGITPDVNDLAAPETEYVVRRNYADAVTNAGGLPFILPYGEQVDEYLEAVDGLLVTGGVFDINPVLYRQTARKQYVMKPARTDFERALIKGALSRSMPILGICNGMQLLAVCLGGELVQDIPTEVDGALEHKPEQSASLPHHEIEIRSDSLHFATLDGDIHRVNSVHHQSVLPNEAYQTLALSPDGVVEAIEAKNHSFAVGVQWHPEYGVADIDKIIFAGFIAKALDYSERKK
ncbi:gamma-glutamyl-gamma-aminobutyrate hydrolase family protein (plasmid) [Sinorhizobium garamanticum]|uniref:Gamma-glutamyl-gamma-aminobutyrate hydrolase family protein n=1 Tax=Sinorhizobium garamanticum TaxID=680247 RepID=A0ABY8DL77_9HYPH|nr:gamma-glutamyl-gamma-aminobutyrate hydrolase family protein [Sinorhizobium garamanticum]WEX91651.1 gamma-glutamyl-gamma-aminobutyrate hydrolase family protein [Sinorhizobium garamanticum]